MQRKRATKNTIDSWGEDVIVSDWAKMSTSTYDFRESSNKGATYQHTIESCKQDKDKANAVSISKEAVQTIPPFNTRMFAAFKTAVTEHESEGKNSCSPLRNSPVIGEADMASLQNLEVMEKSTKWSQRTITCEHQKDDMAARLLIHKLELEPCIEEHSINQFAKITILNELDSKSEISKIANLEELDKKCEILERESGQSPINATCAAWLKLGIITEEGASCLPTHPPMASPEKEEPALGDNKEFRLGSVQQRSKPNIIVPRLFQSPECKPANKYDAMDRNVANKIGFQSLSPREKLPSLASISTQKYWKAMISTSIDTKRREHASPLLSPRLKAPAKTNIVKEETLHGKALTNKLKNISNVPKHVFSKPQCNSIKQTSASQKCGIKTLGVLRKVVLQAKAGVTQDAIDSGDQLDALRQRRKGCFELSNPYIYNPKIHTKQETTKNAFEIAKGLPARSEKSFMAKMELFYKQKSKSPQIIQKNCSLTLPHSVVLSPRHARNTRKKVASFNEPYFEMPTFIENSIKGKATASVKLAGNIVLREKPYASPAQAKPKRPALPTKSLRTVSLHNNKLEETDALSRSRVKTCIEPLTISTISERELRISNRKLSLDIQMPISTKHISANTRNQQELKRISNYVSEQIIARDQQPQLPLKQELSNRSVEALNSCPGTESSFITDGDTTRCSHWKRICMEKAHGSTPDGDYYRTFFGAIDNFGRARRESRTPPPGQGTLPPASPPPVHYFPSNDF